MDYKRIAKHLAFTPLHIRRRFPPAVLNNIAGAIRECEDSHAGEIRFAVEGALPLAVLKAGKTARQRAIEVFSELRVWDTEHNNGVLIYLQLADRKVEIVADRGVHQLTGSATWESICRDMENQFHLDRFEEGAVAGIRAIGTCLAAHYPGHGGKLNELPDQPVVLG
ncbi:MAG: TPM domain-containing protein [Sulfuricella sp.]|nr:TPM domain-containing protein [Sulfuricella sp.]